MRARSLAAVVTAVTFAAAPMVGVAPANAATATAQAGYRCGMQFEGQEDTSVAGQTRHDDNTYAMQLEVPESVTPGQRVNLNGVAALQLSEQARKDYSAYVDSIDAYSESLSVAITVNGRTVVHRADRWQTGRVKIGNPFVVRGNVSFPAFTVPSNARGTIRIGLPQNNVVKNDVDGKPPVVAFTARARAYLKVPIQGQNQYVYYLACWLPTRTEGRIADIAVSAGSATSSSGSVNYSDSDSSDNDDADDNDDLGETSDSLPSGSALAAADPFTAPAAAPEAVPAAGAAGATSAALPPGFVNSSATGGIYLPTSVVLLMGLLALLAAGGYAALMHIRLRAIERYEE